MRNDEGVSPLHNAARGGFHDSVELLLESGVARMIGTTDRNKRTPIMEASAGAHADVVRLLCEVRGRTSSSLITLPAAHSNPSWHVPARPAPPYDTAAVQSVICFRATPSHP